MYSLALALLAAAGTPVKGDSAGPVYRGAERQLAVDLPRLAAAAIRVDGDLSEPVWARSARLTDFTLWEPTEGGAAPERTEVLLLYTPQALYLGVRAYAKDPSRIRATLAERDKIGRDDQIQILLDTFNDRRRAYLFAVNPLGIQQDGIYNESSNRRGGERSDLSLDLLWESRGRLTADGYSVEIRIPFKSLRYSTGESRSWGINIFREHGATGVQDSWAPLTRANASQLAQAGTLQGIGGLRPGRLWEVNPATTAKREGRLHDGQFEHGGFEPDLGINLKYGLTPNLALDVTFNPDFSQVEADADQITVNERFDIQFPEKRPFFLEGADIFATPEQLVYTRSIVDPRAGVKLSGKAGAWNVGYLGALDDSPFTQGRVGTYAPDTARAQFNIARLQREIGAGGSLGFVLTDRRAGEEENQVAAVDARLRFRDVYTWAFQGGGSLTQAWQPGAKGRDSALIGGRPTAVSARRFGAHLVSTSLDRSGRVWGFRLQMKDIPEDFRASSGFVRRVGVTDFFGVTRLTLRGKPGALIESWGPFLSGNRIYEDRTFWHGQAPAEGEANLNLRVSLRGNNRFSVGSGRQFYVLDPSRYDRYSFTGADGSKLRGGALVAPFRELRGLRSIFAEGNSSYFRSFSFGGGLRAEEVAIFAEGTRGLERSAQLGIGLQPTGTVRADLSVRYSRITRDRDGSEYSEAFLPRLKIEYQLHRAAFVRAITQYSLEEVDLLRAPDGTPYLRNNATGAPEGFRLRRSGGIAASAMQRSPLRTDLLFAYQPSPGTVVFLGYGREMTDRGRFRFSPLEPRADGLFLKLSYLFRG